MNKCAVFSCLGLGDGLIALVLSNNLRLNGWKVTTFHPFLSGLQNWFPQLPIRPFPSEIEPFDRYFIIYEKTPWMQKVLAQCPPEKTTILNPIATKNRDYPYWENGRFDGTRPFVENLYNFSHDVLKFAVATRSNGIVVPDHVQPRRFPQRIIFHPSSSRPGKNWSQEKFLRLADALKQKGFQPSFLLLPEEREGWDLGKLDAPLFPHLTEMAGYVAESGAMIGNDSGIGHLASCLGLATLTVCRSQQSAKFWRPAWARGEIITPSAWIPNIKGLRLRDKHWKKWISVRRALNQFLDLR